jgi:transketolase
MDKKNINNKELAWLIRRHGIEMTHLSQASHIASILSVADIIGVLYADVIKVFPKNPKSEQRDLFVLSKGHAGAAIYATLAELGFFDRAILKSHCQNGSILSGHVSHKGVPGVDASTGSLGHGLSYAVGMAVALKKQKRRNNVYVVLGDGECDEGAVWEAALMANEYALDNLIAVIDRNQMQSLDFTEKTVKLEPLEEKWRAFNWLVWTVNGHDHEGLKKVFKSAQNAKGPSLIIAETVKGKGVSFMELNILWHYRFPHKGNEYDQAIKELRQQKPVSIKDPYEEN